MSFVAKVIEGDAIIHPGADGPIIGRVTAERMVALGPQKVQCRAGHVAGDAIYRIERQNNGDEYVVARMVVDDEHAASMERVAHVTCFSPLAPITSVFPAPSPRDN